MATSYCTDMKKKIKIYSMEYHPTCWVLLQQFEPFWKQINKALLFACVLECNNFNRKQNQILGV